jgi:hypothetical protein
MSTVQDSQLRCKLNLVLSQSLQTYVNTKDWQFFLQQLYVLIVITEKNNKYYSRAQIY